VVALSITFMFTLWSCLFYHIWSCHLLLWYLVVLGIVLIFVVVIVSFHFILWCLVVVGSIFVEVSISFHFLVWCMKVLLLSFLLLLLLLSLILLLCLVHCHCCSCHLLLLSFFFFNQFSLLGLVHEGVEGVVKGVHEVGVVDWRLSACEL